MRTNEELDRAQRRTAAYAQYMYVDVVFGEAGVDVVVPHKLRPSHPENIIYELVKATQACTVYQDGSSTRRPWGDGYIVLRCDVTNARVRLRLAVESEIPIGGQTSGLSVGSGGNPPPIATPFLVEHYADGLHKFPIEPWTPTIGGTGGQSGQVYSLQNGHYVKVGPLVSVYLRVQLSTLGTITNLVQIKGLPFQSTASTGFRARWDIAWNNLATSYVSMQGGTNENESAITLVGLTAAATGNTGAFLAQANLTNTSLFLASGVYLTDQ